MKKNQTLKSEETKIIDIRKIRFSPEIEAEFDSKKIDAQNIIQREKIRGWTIKDEALDNGCEFVPNDDNKLYWNAKGLRQILDVLKRIKTYGGKCTDNCGLHIHIDMSLFTDKQIVTIMQTFIHKQKWIIKRFKVKKSRSDEMCKLLPRKNLIKITEKNVHTMRKQGDWYSQYDYFDRWSALNILSLGDTGSLEFRLFNGTLDYDQLKRCIHYCLMFVKECGEWE